MDEDFCRHLRPRVPDPLRLRRLPLTHRLPLPRRARLRGAALGVGPRRRRHHGVGLRIQPGIGRQEPDPDVGLRLGDRGGALRRAPAPGAAGGEGGVVGDLHLEGRPRGRAPRDPLEHRRRTLRDQLGPAVLRDLLRLRLDRGNGRSLPLGHGRRGHERHDRHVARAPSPRRPRRRHSRLEPREAGPRTPAAGKAARLRRRHPRPGPVSLPGVAPAPDPAGADLHHPHRPALQPGHGGGLSG